MPCDVNTSWWLMFPWQNDAGVPPILELKYTDPPTNSIPNVRTFTEWVTVLQLGQNTVLCDIMTNYPAWFTQMSPAGLVTSFEGRQGAVVSQAGDYTTDEVTNTSTVPGATTTAALDYLLANAGTNPYWETACEEALGTPPVTPVTGGHYLILSGTPTGAWAGFPYQIAVEDGLGGYTFLDPPESCHVAVKTDTDGIYRRLAGAPGIWEKRYFDDHLVLATVADVAAGTLEDKITVDASGITATPVDSGGGNMVIELGIPAIPAADDKKVKVTTNDTTANFLQSKLAAGTNVTITLLNAGANEQLSIAASAGAAGTFGALHVYDNVGGTDIRGLGGAWVDVPFNTNVRVDADYTKTSNTVYTINTTGTYMISAKAAVQEASGNPRCNIRFAVDTGAGYVVNARSEGDAYADGGANVNGSAHTGNIILDLAATNTLKVQATGGVGNIPQLLKANGSTLTIIKIA